MSAPDPSPGRIVTFYSYKGGTGRSMALANIAWILASAGKRVLMIDWDLEAPGLHRYFHPFLADPELSTAEGIIDFVVEFASAALSAGSDEKGASAPAWFERHADLTRWATSLTHAFPKPGTLDLVPAGRQDAGYPTRINSFDWRRFYEELGGGLFMEAVKQRLRSEYDWILIDSRTGVSDTSGICTVQMPDDLVVCFTVNRQSREGAAAVAHSALEQRHRPDGTRALRVWPVPTRIEPAEKEKLDRALDSAHRAFRHFLDHLPAEEHERYWGEVQVPYQPFYAYEEVLATLGDRPFRTGSMLMATEALTRWLTGGEVVHMARMEERTREELLRRYTGAQPAPFLAFLSYARDASGTELSTFVEDLRTELAARTGLQKQALIFFDDISLGSSISKAITAAIEACPTVIVIVTPSYGRSAWCMRELEAFLQRGKQVLPVLWTSVGPEERPAALDPLQLLMPQVPPEETRPGTREAMRSAGATPAYLAFIEQLADRIAATAQKAGSGVSSGTRSLSIGARLIELAKHYDELRSTMSSGDERTRRMGLIATEMRGLALSIDEPTLQRLMASNLPGERLAAIAALQVWPRASRLNWLADRLTPGAEKPFVSYHAAVALLAAARQLGPEHLDALSIYVDRARANLGGRFDTDRHRVLMSARQEIERRRIL